MAGWSDSARRAAAESRRRKAAGKNVAKPVEKALGYRPKLSGFAAGVKHDDPRYPGRVFTSKPIDRELEHPLDRVFMHPNLDEGHSDLVHDALNHIGEIHSLPASRRGVHVGASDHAFEGLAGYHTLSDVNDPREKAILVHPRKFLDHYPVYHEHGHHLDEVMGRIFGGDRGEFATATLNHPDVSEFRRMIKKTEMHGKANALLNLFEGNPMRADVTDYIKYKLQPIELFADAYAHYIAHKKNPDVINRESLHFNNSDLENHIVPYFDELLKRFAPKKRKFSVTRIGHRNEAPLIHA